MIRLKRQVVLNLLWLLLGGACVAYGDGAAPEPQQQDSSQVLLQKVASLEQALSKREVKERAQLSRIKRVEKGLNKLVTKKSFKTSIMGTVLSAAATAHPVGAIVGGVVGAIIGRGDDYEAVESKLHEMEQDIIVSEEDFLTAEELRLADFSALPAEVAGEPLEKPATNVVAPSASPLDSCYGRAGQNRSVKRSRQAMAHCFYSMH